MSSATVPLHESVEPANDQWLTQTGGEQAPAASTVVVENVIELPVTS
jgi:hypothetical protein